MNQKNSSAIADADQVKLTAAAAIRIKEKLHGHQGIRLAIKLAGCSGYKYHLEYVDGPTETDYAFPYDETLTVFVDAKSFPFIKGTIIDVINTQWGYDFRYQNPNEAATCGCGESFTVQDTEQK